MKKHSVKDAEISKNHCHGAQLLTLLIADLCQAQDINGGSAFSSFLEGIAVRAFAC